MKTTALNILAYVLLTTCSGCKERIIIDPHQIRNYFVFTTAEGGNFFDSDNRYSADKVTFSCQPHQSILNISGFHVFEAFPWSCESIIDFGNGDLDTLKMIWLPGVYGAPTRSEDLIKATYYYNGTIIDTWDFRANPRLIIELGERNVPDTPDWTNNPIVVKIPKTADEDELR